MAATACFTYQFCDNASGVPYETKIPMMLVEDVHPSSLGDSDIDAAEQIPLHCFDNVINTLIKNKDSDPTLRFCIGLQQDTVEEEKVVEHCWIQKGDAYYDSSSELNNSRYFLFCSLSLAEIFEIMHCIDIDHVPNITTLRELRRLI